MKIAVLKERAPYETRVALTPDTAKAFIKAGFTVSIEKDAGLISGFLDEEYVKAGAYVSGVPLEIVSDADIILKVQPTPASDKIKELEFARQKAVIIGLLSPFANLQLIQNYAERKIIALSMEMVPRITKAQSMDALSSQSNLAGYRAVIEAAHHFGRAMPMMMTAAGTIKAARVVILGTGVAGLQAIATANRLGAVVEASDVRPAAKEQVESLGAKFIDVPFETDEEREIAQGVGGYARPMPASWMARQAVLVSERCKQADLVIATALIPGRPAPTLISAETVRAMKPGSVIIDLAVERGGNCPLSQKGQVVQENGVTLVGLTNLPGMVATDASALYARNLLDFLKLIIDKEGKLAIARDDDIVQACLVCEGGQNLRKK
jgi:NAD(P) transhydrogenase subunit alpha